MMWRFAHAPSKDPCWGYNKTPGQELTERGKYNQEPPVWLRMNLLSCVHGGHRVVCSFVHGMMSLSDSFELEERSASC